MAIENGMTRVSLVGTLPQGEQFVTSFWVGAAGITTSAGANAFAAQVRDAFQGTALNPSLGIISPASAYRSVRTYSYDGVGNTADYIGEAPIANGTGGGSGSTLPLQCCMVLSLRTGLPGRRRRGRMYLPANQQTLASHQFQPAICTQIVEAWADFFTAVNGIASAQVVVVSQVGAGDHNLVTQLLVDTRVDIQRRRAQDQAVQSVSADVVTGQ